jgi:carbamoyl-phosphate synthase large subunit
MHATVLFSSAGRRVGLIECFRRSAQDAGIELEVLACDVEPELSAACSMADRAFKVPRCDSDQFIDRMVQIAADNGVNLIVPTIDTELGPLAAATGRFYGIGARVHVSPPAVIDVVRDKVKTAEALAAAGVPVPWTIPLEDAHSPEAGINWPAFLKPSGGSASRGIRIVQNIADLPSPPDEPMMLQQLLVGPEYTVNMFIDEGGTLRSAVAHQRLRIRAGEVEKGRTERDPMFRELAEGVYRAIPDARGVLCFQVIMDAATGPRVFEINARFGGGYPLAHFAGAEYARWLLEEVVGLPSTAHDRWRSGALMLRYDAAAFSG